MLKTKLKVPHFGNNRGSPNNNSQLPPRSPNREELGAFPSSPKASSQEIEEQTSGISDDWYSAHPSSNTEDEMDGMSDVGERNSIGDDVDEDTDSLNLAMSDVGVNSDVGSTEDNNTPSIQHDVSQNDNDDNEVVDFDDNTSDQPSEESDSSYYQQDYYGNFNSKPASPDNMNGDPEAMMMMDMSGAMSDLPAHILEDIAAAKDMMVEMDPDTPHGSYELNNNGTATSSAEEGDGYSNLYKDDENPKDLLAASSSISDAPQAVAEPPLVKVSQDGNVTPAQEAQPRRKWSPFPASTPTEVDKEISTNEKNEDSDFASMLKQASTKLSHQNEEKEEEVPEKAPWKKASNSGPLSISTEDDIQSSKDYPQTPNDHTVMMTNIEKLTNITSPDDESSNIYSPTNSSPLPPATSDVVKKIIKDNQKLRKRKKELLTLLSSTAQQFSSYEKVCTQKICKLEEENKRLHKKKSPRRLNRELQLAKTASAEIEELLANKSAVKMYDGEVVRKLSNGVLKQEKQLESKDELITQLKLRCEVLKQSLLDRDGEILQEKKLWEDERSKLLGRLDGDSPVKESNHGELLSKKMEVTRLKKELETALSDITMLTSSLETNNVALDSAVLELDKLKEVKAGNGIAVSRTTDKLKKELSEKEGETTQLQSDLESALDEIEQLRKSVTAAASAQGYDDFQNVVEDLKIEMKRYKSDANTAKDELVQVKSQLEESKSELTKLRVDYIYAEGTAPDESTVGDGEENASADNIAAALNGEGAQNLQPTSGGSARRFRLPGFGQKTSPEESANLQTMVRQRDLKIKSLEAMIHSNTRIMDKMKGDIERMDNDKEEAEYTAAQKIEKLTEENKMYEMQVAGFEKTFMNLNERTLSGGHTDMERSLSEAFKRNESDIVDEALFMSDDAPDQQDTGAGGSENNKAMAELRENNLSLERMLSELQSSNSNQEDQIEKLNIELIKLRVKSQQEKETEVAHLTEENKIVIAQRSALENQLVEINKSAGVLRDGGDDQVAGDDPVLVSQVVMLENANKVLESTVDSLRSDMQEKLAPLLEQIAHLESEKEIIEEEMDMKLELKEMTIKNLESSLKQLQSQRSPKGKRGSKKASLLKAGSFADESGVEI